MRVYVVPSIRCEWWLHSGQSKQSWANARIRTPRKTSYQLTFLQSPICLFNFQVANPIEQRIHHFLKPQLSAAREKSLIWRLIDRALNNPAPADRQPPNSISSINADLQLSSDLQGPWTLSIRHRVLDWHDPLLINVTWPFIWFYPGVIQVAYNRDLEGEQDP